ncbi:phosphocholine cytidylyltransferase family protein [Aliifodinibius sp. S!AR15-10]|uniref:phosphocholine cytidylyltransferase family protein n=1 Tax=Aliifodinibius sp. S!AR15-10 TaxID=2950437 RepID=UPI0028648FD9|nr:phosphocholine cytidylyltransferase family protein [Aliifodinibius sp. S!AR15-10]MDR8393040.1 phosphocholine cytidylyltransferase family protein [Aliifodinibius sp. S!AR15-10]
MSNDYTAIILAAGKGTRLRPLTNRIPKCMIPVDGKPMLEWQLEVLVESGIENIIVVTGYLEDKIDDLRITKVHNSVYDSTNMVHSLFCAEKYLEGKVIVSYGDIIYSKRVLQKLMDNEQDMVVASDMQWLPYWQKRCSDPLSDAETFETGPWQTVLSLGGEPNATEEIDGQYIGLTKLSDRGCRLVKEAYHNCRDHSKRADDAWGSGRDLRNAYMTDLLNHFARTRELFYTPIQRGWFEVDTPMDLDIAYRQIRDSKKRVDMSYS